MVVKQMLITFLACHTLHSGIIIKLKSNHPSPFLPWPLNMISSTPLM